MAAMAAPKPNAPTLISGGVEADKTGGGLVIVHGAR